MPGVWARVALEGQGVMVTRRFEEAKWIEIEKKMVYEDTNIRPNVPKPRFLVEVNIRLSLKMKLTLSN